MISFSPITIQNAMELKPYLDVQPFRTCDYTLGAVFQWRGELAPDTLGGHNTAPLAYDWNQDGRLDLLVGAEDGHIYCYHRNFIAQPNLADAQPVETQPLTRSPDSLEPQPQ